MSVSTVPTRPAPPIHLPPSPDAVLPGNLVEVLLRERRGVSDHVLAGRELHTLIPRLAAVATIGGAIFGVAIGLQGGLLQATASAIKVPLVLLVGAGLSLPILHVSTALNGVRLRFDQLAALVLQSLATATVTMAGLAPLIAVVWLSLSAMASPGWEDQAWYIYRRLFLASVGVAGIGALAGAARLLRVIPFRAAAPWALSMGLGSLQLGWLLRPVVGMPNGEFVLLRGAESNALTEVLTAFFAVLG